MKFELKPTLAKLDGAQGNNAKKKKNSHSQLRTKWTYKENVVKHPHIVTGN